jgi:Holliday junction DNA helicase RuvA
VIARLRGEVLSLSGDTAIVDVNGVGYELTITRTVCENGAKAGNPIDLTVYTDVKENAISLFGFASRAEREVFLLLRKVKGVGPKMSLAIVSTLGAEAVLRFIGLEDAAAIQRAPGVGKKLAERIIVELREEVGRMAGEAGNFSSPLPVAVPKHGRDSSVAGDAALALEKLGFSAERAWSAVENVAERARTANGTVPVDAGEYLRRALAEL